MKLDEFRRNASKGIHPDHKVEKSRFCDSVEVEKLPSQPQCLMCGKNDFYNIENRGNQVILTCIYCGIKRVFYHCANVVCYDLVEVNGLYCEKCKREVITSAFMDHMSKEA